MTEQMKRDVPRHSISGVFVFLLLGIFALFSTFMVLLGAQLYRDVVDETELHNRARVRANYLLNAIRGNDQAGGVYVEEIDGVDVLTFRMGADDEVYLTRIYCSDGALRERFMAAEDEFEPDYGEHIAEAASFEAQIDGGMVTLRITDESGEEQVLQVALRCPQEVSP